MGLLLGIDLGTSYFKVGLFDETGVLKGLGRIAMPTTTPAPGRCELAVDDFWKTLRTGLDQALAQANARANDIEALSYSSQASTFLLLDRSDAPLTPLIVWTDSRGGPVPDDLGSFARTNAFRGAIGFEGLSEQSAAVKWRWFQRQESETWSRVRGIMTVSDYLTFALTGERAGDASTATFLGLYDLANARWWPEALAAFGLEAEKLSAPLRPGSACGKTTSRATALLGLPRGIPFAVGALDHHVAAIGSGLERHADVSISTGTVLAALALVDTPTPQAGCYHGCHVDGRRFWRLAFDASGAGQLEQVQRRFATERRIEDLLELAARVPAGVGWTAEASPDPGIATRVVLERIAASHRVLVRRIAPGRTIRGVVATGGGARSALWLQIMADVLDVPVTRVRSPECACLGAATFAAVAAGRHATMADAASSMIELERRFEPEPRATEIYRELLGPTR